MSNEERQPYAIPVQDSEDQEPITTADGAVRQLEKGDIAKRSQPGRTQPPDNEVISLGKSGDGAPEEEAADASEVISRS